MKVQSGTSGAMSSPVDRITFAAANAVGSQWGSAIGPITDTWFQVSWTITGTTPSFTFICAVGAL
ncbi:MAG TPA: hypothetical protein VFQ79_07860 [Bryobacteraceae bacterium]|nr:hypothetical protein [Bryobacteraceae bacterium]